MSEQPCRQPFFIASIADIPPNNGAVLNIAHIIEQGMASATEAKLAALYITACKAFYIHIILQGLGNAQPATPLQMDNSMVEAVINGKIQPKHTKAMDMHFHWLCDCECQNAFIGDWANSTMPIIGLNTTPYPIIVPYTGDSSHH
jgi:hypothetical protein